MHQHGSQLNATLPQKMGLKIFKSLREMGQMVQDIVFLVMQWNAFSYAQPWSEPHSRSSMEAHKAGLNTVEKEICAPFQNSYPKLCCPTLHGQNWQDTFVTKPFLTEVFSNEEIDSFIQQQHFMQLEKLLHHTQAVERCVKLMIEASSVVRTVETIP